MKHNSKEKKLWNEAVKRVCNEIKLYDGIIPCEIDRLAMAQRIKDKFTYKRIK